MCLAMFVYEGMCVFLYLPLTLSLLLSLFVSQYTQFSHRFIVFLYSVSRIYPTTGYAHTQITNKMKEMESQKSEKYEKRKYCAQQYSMCLDKLVCYLSK